MRSTVFQVGAHPAGIGALPAAMQTVSAVPAPAQSACRPRGISVAVEGQQIPTACGKLPPQKCCRKDGIPTRLPRVAVPGAAVLIRRSISGGVAVAHLRYGKAETSAGPGRSVLRRISISCSVKRLISVLTFSSPVLLGQTARGSLSGAPGGSGILIYLVVLFLGGRSTYSETSQSQLMSCPPHTGHRSASHPTWW